MASQALVRDIWQSPRYGMWMTPPPSSLLALPAPGGACRRSGPVLFLSLAALSDLWSVVPAPPPPSEVVSLFAGRVPLGLSGAGKRLKLWRAELVRGRSEVLPGWHPEGPGRSPEEAAPLIEYLGQMSSSGKPVRINALRREVGGRLMSYCVPQYDGPVTITKRNFDKAPRRYPLVAIRRDVRALLTVPEGYTRLDADYGACFGGVAAALSRDPQLQEDVDSDWHAVTGAGLVPGGTAKEQRSVGKAVNLPLLHGGGPSVILDAIGDHLGATDRSGLWGWAVKGVQTWWARYPELAALRDQFQSVVRRAQAEKLALVIVAPSGRKARFRPSTINGSFSRSGTPKGHLRAWTTPWSAIFRLVESDVMDNFYRELSQTNVRLGLPLYDGCILAAPKGTEAEAAKTVETLGNDIARTMGVRTTMKTKRTAPHPREGRRP